MSFVNNAILWGGGKESLLSLHKFIIDKKRHHGDIMLLHYNYGQIAFYKEKESGEYYASKYSNCSYNSFEVNLILPDFSYTNHVPARNGILLGTAVNWCVSNGVNNLLCPYTADFDRGSDSTNTSLQYMRLAYKELYPQLNIFSNLNNRRDNTHLLLLKYSVDLSKVWSCESGGSTHCGVCYKCRGFLSMPEKHIGSFIKIVTHARS